MPHADGSGRTCRAEEGRPACIGAGARAADRARDRAALQPGKRSFERLSDAPGETAGESGPETRRSPGSRPDRPRKAQPGPSDREARAGLARAAAAAAQRSDLEAADEPVQAERHPGAGANRASAGEPLRGAGSKAREPASAARRAEPRVSAHPRLQHHPRRRERRHPALCCGGCGAAEGHDPAGFWKARRSRRGGLAITEELTYEQAMDKLEETLKRMESDKLTLDEAVKAAEDAQTYFRICAQRLEEARKKIEVRAETEHTA